MLNVEEGTERCLEGHADGFLLRLEVNLGWSVSCTIGVIVDIPIGSQVDCLLRIINQNLDLSSEFSKDYSPNQSMLLS